MSKGLRRDSMRTRNAVALSLQASSRVMKKVMSYQWYLWVYGYQRSHYLKYSGYIYTVDITSFIYICIYSGFFVSSEIHQFSGSLRVFAEDLWPMIPFDPCLSHQVLHLWMISIWKTTWRPWRNVETIRFMDYDHDPNMRSARPYIDASPCSPSSNNWTLLWMKANLRFSDTLPTWFRSWDINLSSMARETIDLPCLARFSKLNKTLVKVLSDPHSLIRGFSWILPFVNQFARGNQHFS